MRDYDQYYYGWETNVGTFGGKTMADEIRACQNDDDDDDDTDDDDE